MDISVAIPTYHRGRVLIETLSKLLQQRSPPEEILVLDQTPSHDRQVEIQLNRLDSNRTIRWVRLVRPSITAAMNTALSSAENDIILFLDDDIDPDNNLVEAHRSAYEIESIWAVAGQVLQPGEEPIETDVHYSISGLYAYLDFPFNSVRRTYIKNGMAGNLSVRRNRAVELGGFDQRFVGSAYRFETDFCRRLCAAGGSIRFEPGACIRHLRLPSGGTRAIGSHLCSPSPLHGLGDYYFAFRHGGPGEAFLYSMKRIFKETINKYHVKRPWCIPVKFIGEIRGLITALRFYQKGPLLLSRQ